MAGPGSTRLSGASTPRGSQVNDDDIIRKQLQADLNSQAESHQTASPMKARKRKSRDMDEGVASGGDESPRKKQKGKDRAKRRQKRLLKSLHENGLDIYHESSSNGADTLQELTNGTQLREKSLPRPVEASSRHLSDPRRTEINRDAKTKEAKDEVRRDSNLAVVTVRTSLGSNREALLQSILKGCSPDKLMNVKAERSLPSESESGDASAAPNVASAMKTSSKGRSRPRVSMVPVLPEGYKPSLAGSKSRFHCPVEGCDKLYTRKTTLGEHMNTLHAGQILNDNKDGTMSIISPEDYQVAISRGNDQSLVQIPNTPHPTKATKAAHTPANDKKQKKTLSATGALREGSVDTDAPDETQRSGLKASKTRRGSSNAETSPAAAKPTPSKLTRLERDSSEYETSGEDESLVIHDLPRPSSDSTTKSPIVKTAKSRSSVDSAVKAPKIKLPMSSKSKGARSSNVSGIHHETSEDEMEDWEIEPGVIAGSSSGSNDDSETEHNTAYSSVYITSAEAGVKLSGVHFQVIRVAPGSTAPGPIIPYLRVCSVAAGKVQVNVGDNQFSIGAHGMWRIRAGEKCTLANRNYSEAVIHVSTVNTA